MASQTYNSGGSTPVYGQTPAHGNTNQGSGTARNPPKRKGGKRFKWPNGSMHTRPYRGHGGGNADAAGGGGNTPAHPHHPVDPLLQQAQAYGRLAYNPQINSLKAQQATVDPYFQDYVNKVTASGTTYTNQSAPVLAQAQQLQQTAGQVTPGTEADPEAQLAAQSRAALTGLGLTTLQGIVNSNQGYFAGQAGPVAAAGKLQMHTDLDRQLGEARRERGQYVVTKRGELEDTAHKNQLEDAAFGVSASESANQLNKYGYTDSEWASFSSSKKNRIRGRSSQGSQPDMGSVNKYGYTEKDWRALPTAKRQQIIHQFDHSPSSSTGGLTPTQRRAARKERGKAINRVNEIPGLWKGYAHATNRVPVYNPNGTAKTDANGNPVTKVVKPTADQIKAQLRKDGYSPSEIRLALAIRSGKPLTAKGRAIAKRLGIWPIPKHWTIGKPQTATTLRPVVQAPGANGQMRPT